MWIPRMYLGTILLNGNSIPTRKVDGNQPKMQTAFLSVRLQFHELSKEFEFTVERCGDGHAKSCLKLGIKFTRKRKNFSKKAHHFKTCWCYNQWLHSSAIASNISTNLRFSSNIKRKEKNKTMKPGHNNMESRYVPARRRSLNGRWHQD